MARGDEELDALLLALREAGEDPHAAGADARIRAGLRHSNARAVAKAAKIVASSGLQGHADDLVAAFDLFMRQPERTDPSCLAKTAVAEALDFTDYSEPAPFLRGIRHVQLEKSWGPPADTAAALRARCALALVRMRHKGVLDLLADLLADADLAARAAAGDAIAFHGDPHGTALLRLKLHVGDEEPEVVASCLKALLALDAGEGLKFAARLLARGSPPASREGAALGLGESRLDEALPLLEEFVRTSSDEKEVALGLHAVRCVRTESSRKYLLLTVAQGDPLRARLAVQAIAAGARDPGLEEAVRSAAAKNARARLEEVVAAAFPRA